MVDACIFLNNSDDLSSSFVTELSKIKSDISKSLDNNFFPLKTKTKFTFVSEAIIIE